MHGNLDTVVSVQIFLVSSLFPRVIITPQEINSAFFCGVITSETLEGRSATFMVQGLGFFFSFFSFFLCLFLFSGAQNLIFFGLN